MATLSPVDEKPPPPQQAPFPKSPPFAQWVRSSRFSEWTESVPKWSFRKRLWPLARNLVEDLEAGWDNCPRRAALGKDGEGRMEGRRILQRAGVERIGIRLAELAAEHETHAARAAVAHRVAAV